MLEAREARRMATALVGKYGAEALDLARARAARAVEVGDDLAHAAWRAVIAAAETLLREDAAAG